ncbi:MAG: glycosyltransferase, partial [Bacteroidetes bacterium]
NPLVSVLVLTYQHAPFIAQCLDGILAQKTSFDVEIILGEDDSTDGTRAICQDYAQQYPHQIRLFLRHEKDKTYLRGRKLGRENLFQSMAAARGTFLAFCEGDDYWTDENKLENQVQLMQQNQAAYCYHDARIFLQSANTFYQHTFMHWTQTLHLQERPLQLTDVYTHWPIHTATYIMRMPRELPPYMYTILNTDMGVFALAIQQGPGVFYNSVASVYRKHAGGFTQLHQFNVFERLIAITEIERHFKYPNPDFLYKFLVEATDKYTPVKTISFKHGNYAVSIKHALRLLWYNFRRQCRF